MGQVLWAVKWITQGQTEVDVERNREMTECLFGDESQQIRSSILKPFLELCII